MKRLELRMEFRSSLPALLHTAVQVVGWIWFIRCGENQKKQFKYNTFDIHKQLTLRSTKGAPTMEKLGGSCQNSRTSNAVQTIDCTSRRTSGEGFRKACVNLSETDWEHGLQLFWHTLLWKRRKIKKSY